MATVEREFEDKLNEALLDELEHEFIGKPNNLVHQTVQQAHDILRAYGDAHDYDVEPIKRSAQREVRRTEDIVQSRMGWPHPAAPHFQMGTSPHTVEGDPVLRFVWEDAPQGVREKWDHTERVDGDPVVFLPEVEVDGLPESRFVRDALHWLRRELT